MFQCIIQQKNGWIHPDTPDTKDVFPEIRLQLNEQLKCFDVRMDERMAIVTDIQDFYRKRGEIEIHYSRCLEKVIKDKSTHKEHKQKREWSLISDIYQELINQNKSTSRDHAALSDVYCVHLVDYLDQVMDDTQRIYKRCREIGYAIHEEILRVLHELYTTMKTYQTYYAEVRQAETKLCIAERQRDKLEMANTNSREKLARSKKYKLIEKEINKKKNKYQEAKLKALKAKNEYQLCLQASNATIHKYFADDLSDIIDLMDFGFDNCIARALLMHCSAEEGRQRSIKSGAEQLATLIGALDSRADKQRFLEFYHPAFMIPKKFEFQGCEDETPEPELQKMLRMEMEQRLQQLQQRVTCLRIESEEVWKTLETAESSLLEMQTVKDHDCTKYFGENAVSTSASMSTETLKLRANRQETEEFYLTKFREYLLGTSKIARLNAKQEYIRQSLLDGSNASPVPSISSTKQKQTRRKRIGRLQLSTQTKLFGGSLEEYLENTKEEIPLIMRSCIRIINLYGMQHQGIFRISGSQLEINNFKECFERGEDPLAEVSDVSDINSVAGVFKLYLRELREPLFPIIYFEKLIEISKINSRNEIVIKLKELIATFPQKIIIVMRYLFAFLNHLAEYSDESMMDSSNLAICFGPTLVNIPEDYDQVLSQNSINDVIKDFIMYQEEIFPDDLGGIKYEKYISEELDDVDIEESSIELTQEEPDTQDSFCSEEEIDISLEDLAHRNSNVQLEEQLSCKKDDSLISFKKNSKDCCRTGLNRKEGLTYIPKERSEVQQKATLTSNLTDSGLSNNYSLSVKSDLSNLNILSDFLSEKANSNNASGITSVMPNEAHISFPSTSLTQPSSSQEFFRRVNLFGLPPTQGACLSLTDSLSAFEANTDIPSRLTRVSTFLENEKYSKYYRNNIDDVLQVSPEYRAECIDDSGNAIVNALDTVLYENFDLQSGQRGNNSQEITNKEQHISLINYYVNSVPPLMLSLEDMTKCDADRKQQNWKLQSVAENVMAQQQLQLSHVNSVSKETENLREIVAAGRAVTTSTTITSDDELQQKLQQTTTAQTTNFSVNRELWQRRATSQTELMLPTAKLSSYSRTSQEFREMRQKHAPDLVMDLPLLAQESIGRKLTSSLPQQQQASALRVKTATSPTVQQQCSCPESPDMSTAAERFAKQNQSTLKKNTKIANSENAGGNSKQKRIETTEHEESGDAKNENIPFKPQIKVKPTILRKPVLLFPQPHTHMSPELARKIKKQTQYTEQFN